jgi:hypothetical protein
MRVWDAYREAQHSGRLDRSQPPVNAEGYNSRGQIAEPDEDAPPLERFDFRGSNAEWAIIKQLHIDWLLTPATDLRENSPREIALAGHNQIAADLEDQSRRWTLLDTEPPAISFEWKRIATAASELTSGFSITTSSGNSSGNSCSSA